MTTAREPPPDTRCLVHMNVSFGSLNLEFMLTIFKGFTVDWFYLSFGECVCVCYSQTLKMHGLKLVFKAGKRYWTLICLWNRVQFIDSLA